MKYDVVVVGAGASGMVAAIKLARGGLKVALIERQNRGGKKILASGNGHCNIANINISPSNFYTKEKSFVGSFLGGYSVANVIEFFKSIGLEIRAKDDGKLYPHSMQASAVLNLLEAEIARLNIDSFYSSNIKQIEAGFRVHLEDAILKANSLILATGSMAAPTLGGNGSGLEIAQKFGHKISKQLPALVPLLSKDPICKTLAGVKHYCRVKLFLNGSEATSINEDFLFAKYGVSGLAILDISKDAVMALDRGLRVDIEVDFFPQINAKELTSFLKGRIDKKRDLNLKLWLSGIINSKIANYILRELNFESLSEARVNSKIVKEIVSRLKATKIEICGFREFKYAEVAQGGVELKDIDAKTMQSKLVKNLYFCGEMLDIIGQRGGYNFYFAWISAFRASKAILD